ncbi:M20 family metallo-hydrolase [Papillibacter cinnamivorans]|uniref:N-carbamoyl-L-amino-acid hydrolase n=1 Tax=Papillibacter cinnamivorans DSM 12816 TaxID=1122930 RepID=A0A1W2BFB6_9FIRM|nr:M20 family metallo-hydrolase [Papillibacter cinnamivorans]SMC71619.1 N-carbamoyl-L-amino-acid hydrolase [Papillibacter cinnamivorans DSM 12816]
MKKADPGRIEKHLKELNAFNSTPECGTTRVVFTDVELKGREYVKGIMRGTGLAVKEDSIGNVFATLPGSDPSLAPVWTGSHIDTVLCGGMFDGMAGVFGGIEALRLIRESGIKHKRDISAVVYTSEEPTRFQVSCLGSRAMAGDLTLEDTKGISDKDGNTLYDVLCRLGYDMGRFGEIKRGPGSVYAAVELHVEQNRRLEDDGRKIGIVKAICAPTNFDVIVTGVQSHAGGTSMEARRDAYMAACELALILEKLARENTESEYTTATVGRVKVSPGSVNAIPGRCEFSVDIRDVDFESKRKLTERFLSECAAVELRRGVSVSHVMHNQDIPLRCSEEISGIIEKYVKTAGLPYEKMISGPYHDSMFVGRFAPVGMIFVPSRNGISHSPEEWTDFAEIAAGTDVLAETLAELANR